MSDEQYRKIFVKQLHYYMELKGINQTDLMKDLGLSSSTVSNWCTGLKMPRMGKIQMLADYFGIEKSDLIEDKQNVLPLSEISKLKKQFINRIINLDDETLTRYLKVLDLIEKEE